MVVSESSARRYVLDPDVRLMLEVRDDNATAFEDLVARYQGRLLNVLRHLVGNREQAEDLTQEVFLRVYRARKSYDRAKFATWLFSIANHAASNSLREIAAPRGDARTHDSGPLGAGPWTRCCRPAAARCPRAIGQGRNARHRPLVGRSARRAAADGGPVEQVRGHELRRNCRSDGDFHPGVKSLLSRARENLREVLQPYFDHGASPVLEVHDNHE